MARLENPLSVVDLGGGEEYFSEDYDRVHCIHGTYIGYPGGPDYICGACESGISLEEMREGQRMWQRAERRRGFWYRHFDMVLDHVKMDKLTDTQIWTIATLARRAHSHDYDRS